MNDPQQAIEYAQSVIEGSQVAGKWIRLSCEKFISDLNDPRYEYREDEVSRCLRFLNVLKHFKGSHAGQPFILQPFQVFIVANIVGLYIAGTKYRKYTQSYLQMSRKSGKSFFMCSLSLYFLLADRENSPEILLLANSRKQAIEVDYDTLSKICKKLDPKQKTIKQYRDNLKTGFNDGRLLVLSAEKSTGDGYNCSLGVIDEYHEASDNSMRDLIISSQQNRSRGHCAIITTAGFNLNSPCKQLRDYCTEILGGLKTDDSIFSMIYEMDPDDDWKDSKNWVKSNPCLGVTVPILKLQVEIQKAISNPSDRNGIRTKNLNMWVSTATEWLSIDQITSVSKRIDLSDYSGSVAFVGCDLASVSDLTAVSIYLPEHKIFHTLYYLPEDTITDNDTYGRWRSQGYLISTGGNVTDYERITSDLQELSKILRIERIGYDQWNATQWAIQAEGLGLPLQPYSQSIGNFNKPTREFERMVLSQDITISDNPITRFCLGNVTLKSDLNNNVKPIKAGSNKNKIDGVISMLTALGVSLDNPNVGSGSVFFF